MKVVINNEAFEIIKGSFQYNYNSRIKLRPQTSGGGHVDFVIAEDHSKPLYEGSFIVDSKALSFIKEEDENVITFIQNGESLTFVRAIVESEIENFDSSDQKLSSVNFNTFYEWKTGKY